MMSKSIQAIFPKRVIMSLAVISVVLGLYCYWTDALVLYYRVKFYTGSVPRGRREVAARLMTQRNPFFDRRFAVLINMRLPSSAADRLKVYELATCRSVFATRVMHGKHSGKRWATRFANAVGSNKTALGRYVVVGSYWGKFGKAYRLTGLDQSNSNAMPRSIVLHSSAYVSNSHMGRSEGCPAVSRAALAKMGRYLKTGTLIWIYR